MTYKTILLAVDLHDSYDDHTIERAVALSKEQSANLYVVHCVEGVHAYGAAEGYQLILEVEKQQEYEATSALLKLCEKYGIDSTRQKILKGSPKNKVVEEAKKINADLIVVGEHGRHGISLLLGSTADGIIHHAHCDVLAIRARK